MLKSVPWLVRIPLAALVFAGAMYVLMRMSVGSAIEDAIAASPENITYDAIFLRWNGDFGIEGVKGAHPLPDGSEKAYTADSVTVHTPGLPWLARIGWAGRNTELPDDIGLSVEDFRMVDDDDATPGNWSNLPFDAVGCGERQFTPADLAAMGLLEPRRNVTLRLTRRDDHASTFRLALESQGVGASSLDAEIGIERPLLWGTGPMGLAGAPIRTLSTTMTDWGFISARNAHCARLAGVNEAAFNARHMQALDTHLAEEGMTLGVGALDRYEDFAANGGELQIVSVGDTRLTLGDLIGPDRVGTMASVRMGIRHDGGALANFEMGTQPKIARVEEREQVAVAAPVAVDATNAVAAPIAVAPAATTGRSSSAPADTLYARTRSDNLTGTEPQARARIVATGDTVPYASLDRHIGQRVQVRTKMASIRTGTVLSTNSYQTNLKLDAEDGGFTLNIFADTVAEVRLVPASN